MKITILIVLALLVTLQSYSQCATTTSLRQIKPQAGKLDYECPAEVEVMTKQKNIYEKTGHELAAVALVKSGEEYYFRFLITRRLSPRFTINKNNPIKLQLDNKETIKLYPGCNFKGYGTTWYTVVAFYKISKEQLELLSSHPIHKLDLYLTTPNTMALAKEDEEGTYIEKEIQLKKYRENCMAQAKCILSL